MTNKEKFIEVMNDTFGAGLSLDNMVVNPCSPCGTYRSGACDQFVCDGCRRWWDKQYVDPSEKKEARTDG